VIEFLPRFRREREIRPLHDGIHRAGSLAEAAIDALHHVDVVAHRAPGSVVAPRPRLDGDGLGRADRLAKLAGYAALLAVRITAQGMLAAEARALRVLLMRVIDRRLRLEEAPHRGGERLEELLQQ